MDKPLAIDLFAGAGGMSEGLIQAGFHIIYSNEINSSAALTYQKRHEQLGLLQGVNTFLDVRDICDVNSDEIFEKINSLFSFKNRNVEIDAVFGGPPCQGFSRAGKQDEKDGRNTLFKEYIRIISEVNPKYVVFENVPGIVDVRFQNFKSSIDDSFYQNVHALDIIVKELNKIGYNCLDYAVLNAADFGIPQNRNRFILIAYQEGQKAPKYPNPSTRSSKVSVFEALADLIDFSKPKTSYQIDSVVGRTSNIKSKKPIESNEFYNNDKTQHLKYIQERFSLLKEGEGVLGLRRRIANNGIDLAECPHLVDFVAKKIDKSKIQVIQLFKNEDLSESALNALLTKKNTRIKLDRNKPSSTIVTLPDDIISPFSDRTFSVRELARLQSFDDSFVFYGKRTTGSIKRRDEAPQYTQVGNAVPPLLAKAIALEILKVL